MVVLVAASIWRLRINFGNPTTQPDGCSMATASARKFKQKRIKPSFTTVLQLASITSACTICCRMRSASESRVVGIGYFSDEFIIHDLFGYSDQLHIRSGYG
jgi:hypothetical protein